MRQLSLTETETFVNLAKHALETLRASDDDDADVKDAPRRYSDDANNDMMDENIDEKIDNRSDTAAGRPLKTIHSEPVFKRRGKKGLGRLVAGMGQMEEADEAVEMEPGCWRQSSVAAADAEDDDMLQFIARSTSDVKLNSDDDETTHLNHASNLLLC